MEELSPLRKRIDAIDDEILRLLNQRAEVVLEVAKVKHSHQAPLHVPERERAILERLTRDNPGPFPNRAVAAVFREIISACLNMEGPVRVAYFGPEATFTHQAAHHYFGSGCTFLPRDSIPEVIAAVEKGDANYGVVPVENSTEGSVTQTLDGVAMSEVSVCGELVQPIHQCLLAADASLDNVSRVYTHPQPLAQCRNWLRQHLPKAELREVASTAQAARSAAAEPGCAAIASRLAADVYGLTVLAENIEDQASNRTRFWVLATEARKPTGEDKTSVLVSIKDKPGSLHAMLAAFDEGGINLTKIESRPSKQRPWEYLFFIDFQGHPATPEVAAVLEAVRAQALWVKVLGSYPITADTGN